MAFSKNSLTFTSSSYSPSILGPHSVCSSLMSNFSNAFTSNGYAVLGSSIPGKLNSIALVWGGYLLSGVGTATLTAAILINHFNNKIKHYDDKFEELEDLIKQINKD